MASATATTRNSGPKAAGRHLAKGADVRDTRQTKDSGAEVVLGEDWVSGPSADDGELQARRSRRGFISINRSPLARKIITFNLLGLIVLVAGVLYLNPFRDSLVFQHERGLVAEAELVADVMELISGEGALADASQVQEALATLDLRDGSEIFVFDADGRFVASTQGLTRPPLPPVEGMQLQKQTNLITGWLNRVWEKAAGLLQSRNEPAQAAFSLRDRAQSLVAGAVAGGTRIDNGQRPDGSTLFTVATPVVTVGAPVGAVVVASADGALDDLVRSEREQVLQMFVIAILVSIGLSLLLASTIANPLSDLAAAAEIGRDRNAGKVNPGRVRIPDLAGRPDEIGRLSTALRGMVNALYDRIDANEQFAADVAHEIKNPLASLRSAVGTLRLAKRDDQREKLLDVIEHDVRRLDRLVSDISNASRLDSELVKEDEEPFDLLKMLRNLTDYLSEEAHRKEVDFITDLPGEPIIINGLEARLAQVFVNLITNALSFCEEGDAIRVWARQRDNRVLVVVEDTGPGIPEGALTKIFKRFYSERPENQFGNNSGLGLAISKQIVEAHGGVIWAENIRPTDADITSEPLGARFVVGLPV